MVNTTAGEECDDPTDPYCDNCVALADMVGSFAVNDGPSYVENPPKYTCLEACVEVFGAGTYACSTSSTTITNTAYYSGWGDGQYCTTAQPEDFSLNTTYNCGSVGCSYSAYVFDHCFSSTNYCWVLD